LRPSLYPQPEDGPFCGDKGTLLTIVIIIKSMRMRPAGHVKLLTKKKKVYRLLVGKPEGKRPLGRLRRKWIIKISDGPLVMGRGGGWCGLDCSGSGLLQV
jgi:hypothetical protein